MATRNLVGLWHGGLSDESVEDMANANLHVMRFLGLDLEDDVPDHSVLSCFRTRLTAAHAWHILLAMAYNLKRLPRLFIEL
ncbi:MAG: transposase [Nitrosomonas sp.]|nr:transposase [Nitrosomonas sp.]